MSYAAQHLPGQIIHDADSHLMELADCLDPFMDAKTRAAYDALPKVKAWPRDGEWVLKARAKQSNAQFRAGADENILLRKDYEALGSFLPADRPRALDLLGFNSQLVFTTWCLSNFNLEEPGGDAPLAYALAQAHNRMMTDFCSVDRRFLGVHYVPLNDFAATRDAAAAAIKLGAKALMVPSKCPPMHSPSHLGLDPLWAQAQEAGIPVLFHVGGEEKLPVAYYETGAPKVKDFHGGEENFTSVSYMMIPHSVMLTLSAMIIDGVFDRFPRLKVGVIELGGSWAPGWMRYLDAGVEAFRRGEDRLKALKLKPSEYVRRQIRITPYPHEDAAWCLREGGSEVFMFSSDYPHVEGGRNPLKRFSDSLAGTPASIKDRFYRANFEDLMGAGLSAELRGRQSGM
jgi:uncharacterized protein